MVILATIINWVIQLLIIVIVIQAVLSFFMDPYHPVRRVLDSVVNPMLNPIRRFLPPIANLDFSPIVLIVILQLLGSFVVKLILSFA
jgi:YggT family protein